MSRPRVLFMTVSEHGEANSVLAVMHALGADSPGADFDLHLASFASLRARAPAGAAFHVLPGRGNGDFFRAALEEGGPAAGKDSWPAMMAYVSTRPGLLGTLRAIPRIVTALMGSQPAAAYLDTARAAARLLAELEPDVVVVGAQFFAARDAVERAGTPWLALSPNTLKEVAAGDQGGRAFKWPVVNTGYAYPVSGLRLVPNAICLLFIPIYILLLDRTYRALTRARHAAGYPGPSAFMAPRTAPLLCMSAPAAEYAPVVIPDDIVCCGPMLLPARPVADVDPALAAWLARGPTVLVSLGSHWRLDAADAHAVRAALAALLAARKDVQVLWKLQLMDEADRAAVVAGEDGAGDVGGRLRIVSWLDADPAAIVRQCIICSISHGGSNSFHEALAAGVPQIVLSIWFDTHDFGARVEWLGIGKWGNRRTAPRNNTPDLLAALLAVVGATPDAPGARATAARARELGDVVMRRAKPGDAGVEGRDVAAAWIREFVARTAGAAPAAA